ncbi:DUF559 domain-containing protein [candidate division WOR-3 bacterium]|nr:DUF559 domain-containing protein [candidate division WOR-3 bacterium]
MVRHQASKVLVAILKNKEDLLIARDLHWYRIPVDKADKLLSKKWPPEWLAFYMPKIFGKEAFSVRHYARVLRIEKAKRWQLFPQNPLNNDSDKEYYQLLISDLYNLVQPIHSKRLRRIVFIQTSLKKLLSAEEINDLYEGSKIEEKMWNELKIRNISAERQVLISSGEKNYFLDFAIYCKKGRIDVETDGDFWHNNPKTAVKDNERNNDLASLGWQVLRFSSGQIDKDGARYCMNKIIQTINALSGFDRCQREKK